MLFCCLTLQSAMTESEARRRAATTRYNQFAKSYLVLFVVLLKRHVRREVLEHSSLSKYEDLIVTCSTSRPEPE